jgi:hypothetical protein
VKAKTKTAQHNGFTSCLDDDDETNNDDDPAVYYKGLLDKIKVKKIKNAKMGLLSSRIHM